MRRILSPATNPAGLTAIAAALYTAGTGVWNITHHQAFVDPQDTVSAITAVLALLTRQVVTPVADPRDGNGDPLASPQAPSPGGVQEIALTVSRVLAGDVAMAVKRALPAGQAAPAPVPPEGGQAS